MGRLNLHGVPHEEEPPVWAAIYSSFEGWAAGPTRGPCRTFGLDPYGETLLVATFCEDLGRECLTFRLSVDPLLAPPAIDVDVTGTVARAVRNRPYRPPWPLAADSTQQAQIATYLSVVLASASALVGTYQAFAREFDDDFLHLDLPELAETVAYAWLLASEGRTAIARLETLVTSSQHASQYSSDRDGEVVAVAARAQDVLTALKADERRARRTLVSRRLDNLRHWRS
jgi:hypothetical protein